MCLTNLVAFKEYYYHLLSLTYVALTLIYRIWNTFIKSLYVFPFKFKSP